MRRIRTALAGTALAALVSLTTVACGDDDTVTSEERERAGEAALEEVGEGRVTDVEKGDDDDPFAYEVEVTLDNGNDINVQLDDDYTVLNPSQ